MSKDIASDPGEWVPAWQGADALGVKRNQFFYYVSAGKIRSEPGREKYDGRYSLNDIIKLKQDRKDRKRGKPHTIDWMKITDLPYAIALDLAVYRNEIIGDFNLYRAWLERNPHIAACAYDKHDRRNIWAYVALVPLPEPVIWSILTGEKTENDIRPDDIISYADHTGQISLLAISVVALPEHRALLAPVLEFFMDHFASLAPGQVVTRIFAEGETDQGDRIMQTLRFSSIAIWDGGQLQTLPKVGVLDLTRAGATKVVKRLQGMLREKGVDLVSESFPVPAPVAPRPGGEAPAGVSPPSRPRPARPAPDRPASPGSSEMPAGLVPVAGFANLHGIHENTARKAVTVGRLPVIRNEEGWKHGRAYVKEALDAAGQRAFYEQYASNANFTRCPECPHANG